MWSGSLVRLHGPEAVPNIKMNDVMSDKVSIKIWIGCFVNVF